MFDSYIISNVLFLLLLNNKKILYNFWRIVLPSYDRWTRVSKPKPVPFHNSTVYWYQYSTVKLIAVLDIEYMDSDVSDPSLPEETVANKQRKCLEKQRHDAWS